MDELITPQTVSDNQPQSISENSIGTVLPRSQLSRPLKIILGVATFWPIFCMTAYVLWYIQTGLSVLIHLDAPWENSDLFGPLVSIPFILFFSNTIYIVISFTAILAFILSFLYIMLVFKNEKNSKNTRVKWTIVFSLGFLLPILTLGLAIFGDLMMIPGLLFNLGFFFIIPYIAMPVYWYTHICKKEQNQLPSDRFPYICIPILYFAVLLSFPIVFVGNVLMLMIQ